MSLHACAPYSGVGIPGSNGSSLYSTGRIANDVSATMLDLDAIDARQIVDARPERITAYLAIGARHRRPSSPRVSTPTARRSSSRSLIAAR